MIIVSQFLQFYRLKLKFQSAVEKDGPHTNTFEFSANDVEKLKRFYENVFGWKIIQADRLIDYWNPNCPC
jgi:hypothetical protein